MGRQRTGCCYKVGFRPDIGERCVAASQTTDRSCGQCGRQPGPTVPPQRKAFGHVWRDPLVEPHPTRLHGGSINGSKKTRTTSRRRSSNAPRRIYLCAASDPVLRGQLIVRLFEFGFETGVPIPLSRIRHCSRLSKSLKVRCSLRRFRETLQRWQLWEMHSARCWKAAAGSELVVGAHRSKSSAHSGMDSGFDSSNPGAGSSIEAGQAAYLTLTSDLLVRDERLRWLTALDDSRMALIPGWPKDTQATPVTQDHTPVYGFNGTARLWRQPATAVRRGSVFRVEGAGIRDLTSAAANGRWLGERTHEGFGRFRLDTVLPGITGDAFPAPLQEPHSSADEASEVTAATTRRWFDQHTQPG